MLIWCAFIFGILSWVAYMRMTHRSQKRAAGYADRVKSRVTRLNKDIDLVLTSLEILASHSDRYFHSLQTAGLPELNEICELLHETSIKLIELQAEKRFEECQELCSWLEDTNQLFPYALRENKSKYTTLLDWQDRAREVITSCTTALAAAAEENAQLGVQRIYRKRAPTLQDLRRVREEILDKSRRAN